MKCPNCGAEYAANDRFCRYCGSSVPAAANTAAQAQPIVVQVKQPPPQVVEVHHWHETERTVYIRDSSAPAVSSRHRAVSLLLCAFLGGVGAHKFYEGKIGLGILYLLTFGLFGVGIFVDLLRLLFGRPVDGNGLPIRWR